MEYWEIPDKKCVNDLKDLFASTPAKSDVSPILQSKWKELGPFDFEKYRYWMKCYFSSNFPITKETTTHCDKFGQFPSGPRRYVFLDDQVFYDGRRVNNAVKYADEIQEGIYSD